MSWNIEDLVARRHEFVSLALSGEVSFVELCRRFTVSRKTGYKWLRRFRRDGLAGLHDCPRARGRVRNQTAATVERRIVALRQTQPTWGPRKLLHRLRALGQGRGLPAVSTCARILARCGAVAAAASEHPGPFRRFSRSAPNQLWQVDFKGHFGLLDGGRCHPLTALDDCARFALELGACADQRHTTVQERLTRVLCCYGLPEELLCDNGPPWGGAGPECTALAVWLMRLGVRVSHGRPYHPQTQGKIERFHRTLKADLLARADWPDLAQTQRRFDRYRRLYNHDRPHEALAMATPASVYRPSARAMPAKLPAIAYDHGEAIRSVKSKGEITFRNRFYYVGRAFCGLPLALRPTATDGVFRVCFTAFTLGLIDCGASSDRPKGNYHPLLPADAKCYP